MVLALNESIWFASKVSSLIVSITIERRGLQSITDNNKAHDSVAKQVNRITRSLNQDRLLYSRYVLTKIKYSFIIYNA